MRVSRQWPARRLAVLLTSTAAWRAAKLAVSLVVLAALGGASSWAGVSRLTTLVPSQLPSVVVREGLPGTDDWVSGTAETGCTVRVYTDSTKSWLIGSVVAVDGRYEMSLGDDLYPSVYVTAGDAAGNETAGVVATNHLAWQPAPTVSVVQNPPGVEDRIRGVARPGTAVTVYSDSSLASAVATGVAGRDGKFELGIGDNRFALVWVVGQLGEGRSLASIASNEVTTPPTPAVRVMANPSGTADLVVGSARTGARVEVYRDATRAVLLASGVATGGLFAFSIGDDLASSVFVASTDAAGNPGPGVTVANDFTTPVTLPPVLVLLSHEPRLEFTRGQEPTLMAVARDFGGGALTPVWKSGSTVLGNGEVLPVKSVSAEGKSTLTVEVTGSARLMVTVVKLPPARGTVGSVWLSSPGHGIYTVPGRYRATQVGGCSWTSTYGNGTNPCFYPTSSRWSELIFKNEVGENWDLVATFGQRQLDGYARECESGGGGSRSFTIPYYSYALLHDTREAMRDTIGCWRQYVYTWSSSVGVRLETIDTPPAASPLNRPADPGAVPGLTGSRSDKEQLRCPCNDVCTVRQASACPVNAVFGSLEFCVTDLETPARGFPFRFQRFYNSLTDFRGTLGHCWNHSFGWVLRESVETDGTVKVSVDTEDVKTIWFVRPYFQSTFEPAVAAVTNYALARSGPDGYVLTRRIPDELPLVYHFDSYGSGHRLSRISRAPDHVTTLAYDLPGSPELATRILDTQGRAYELGYATDADGGHLLAWLKETRTGRRFHFRYSPDDPQLVDATDSAAPVAPATTQIYFYGTQRGALQRVSSSDGSTLLTAAYDPLTHRVSRLFHDGAHYRLSYYPERNCTVRTASDGATFVVTYVAGTGAVRLRQDESGGIEERLLDAGGLPAGYRDALGRTTRWVRSDGETTVTGPDGLTWSTRFDADGFLTAYRDPLGRNTGWTYDSRKRLVSVVNEAGDETRFSYGSFDKVTSVQDARGYVTTCSYDAGGNLSELRDAEGRLTRFSYDAADHLTGTVDPAGNASSLAFDSAGRLLATTNALGETHRLEYDRGGRLAAVSDPTGARTSLAFDVWGRLVRVTDAEGAAIVIEHEPDRRRSVWIGPRGGRTTIQYSPGSRTRTRTDAMGHTSVERYDAAGQLEASSGRCVRMIQASGTTVERAIGLVYDAAGNLTALVDGRGKRWTFAYDALDRMTATTDPLGRTTAYEYDGEGNVLRVRREGIVTRETAYDASNRPVRRTYFSTAGVAVETVTFEYDPLGNVTRSSSTRGAGLVFEFDLRDRVTACRQEPLGKTVRVSYDRAGNPSGLSVDGLLAPAQWFSWDLEGRLSRLEAPGVVSAQVAYDDHGAQSRVSWSNGVTAEYAHDAAGRISRMTYRRGEQEPFSTLTLEYDARGNVVRMTDELGGTACTYDALDQLTAVLFPDGTSERYAYDGSGNRVLEETAAGTTNYTVDDGGQLTRTDGPGGHSRTFTFSTRGELLSESDGASNLLSCTWDGAGRLVSIAGPSGERAEVDYLPEPLEFLSWRLVDPTGAPRHLLWTPWGNPLQELGRDRSPVTTYLASEVLDEVYAIQRTGADGRPETLGLVTDHLGSVLRVVTQDGPGGPLRYRPFGSPVESASAPPVETAELTAQLGLSFLSLPPRPASMPALTVAELGELLGASHVVWTEADESGRSVFRAWSRSWPARAGTRVQAGKGTIVLRPPNSAPSSSSFTGSWSKETRSFELLAGLNLVSLPLTVAATRTTAELLSASQARYAVTLTRTTSPPGFEVLLPGETPQPLLAGASYLLSVPRACRLDLTRVTAEPTPLRLGFTSRDSEPVAGLLYLRHRWYSPRLGRFLSQDPIWPQGGLNPYAYANSNPIRWTDPSGLITGLDDLAALALIAALAGNVEFGIVAHLRGANAEERAKQQRRGTLVGLGVGAGVGGVNGGLAALGQALRNAGAGILGALGFGRAGTGGGSGASAGGGPTVEAIRQDVQTGQCRLHPGSAGPSGFGDLTAAEVQTIQRVVDRAGRPLDVVGSAASGMRRGLGSALPIGKGPGTMRDIDYLVSPSSARSYFALESRLPLVDRSVGILVGRHNPSLGPAIRFEPSFPPRFIPGGK